MAIDGEIVIAVSEVVSRSENVSSFSGKLSLVIEIVTQTTLLEVRFKPVTLDVIDS